MKRLYFLFIAILFVFAAGAQQSNSILFNSPDPGMLPPKHLETHPVYGKGPANNHTANKTTTVTTHNDWYDLWDEMYDSVISYSFYYLIYPDSSILDTIGFYAPYHVFTHGMGMSFDPTDSAYYYHAHNPAYQVSAPFPYTLSYQLDSFFVVGQYLRYDTTPSLTDSLIVEFIVTQSGGAPPDSGAYALIFNPADTIYRHCSADETPRFATPRYFNTTDDCIDPLLTKVTHQRYAFAQTAALAFVMNKTRFGLTTPIRVAPGHYLTAYVYFKSQVHYPAITGVEAANTYRVWAGEPNGANVWYPQSSHNLTTGYPGSHQTGLIATDQIRYNNTGFPYAGHNILIPSYAYAHAGANPPSGFDVPEMAFHIKWSVPDTSLATGNTHELQPELNIFPNPCNDVLNVNFVFDHKCETRIIIMNMLGRAVAVKDMGYTQQGNAFINTSELPYGMYLCEIITDRETISRRVAVQR